MVNLKTFLPRYFCWLVLFLAPTIEAATQDIRALFIPDPDNPQSNKFVNKTPSSGYCVSYPEQCQAYNMFSIRVPLRFNSVKALEPNASARDTAMFRVPSDWRGLNVTNAETGETERVEVRIAGIGSQYRLSDTAVRLTGADSVLEGHQALWSGGSWVYAPSPCEISGVGAYSDDFYRFFWKTPRQGDCVKPAMFRIPAMTYEYLDFAYELRTPNPLHMSTGLYTGQVLYTLGPGADFDMGDVMVPDDTFLTLHFTLDVQHALKVEIPPGGEKVQLVPAGGWQSWLQAGRRPVSLFRDQIFNISASSRFKMQLRCEMNLAPDCALENRETHRRVQINVSVSLPPGLTDMAGQPVRHRRLSPGAENALYFQPGFYVDRAPGTLHFEIPPHQMEFMLQPGVAGTYAGAVYVIWDSEI